MTTKKRSDASPLEQVAQRFGQAVVDDMRAHPQRMYNWNIAQFGDSPGGLEMAQESRRIGEEWLRRCEVDADYALDAAADLARATPRARLGVVASVTQVQAEFERAEDEAEAFYASRGMPYVRHAPLPAVHHGGLVKL